MRDTKFSEWVRSYGVKRLCDAMRNEGSPIIPSGVYQWLRGECEPRAYRMRALLRVAGGHISADDILEHFSHAPKPAAAKRVRPMAVR